MALRRLNRLLIVAAGLATAGLLAAPTAEAAVVRGIQEILAGIFQVPLQTIVGTLSGPPVVGTLFGAVNGVVSGVGLVAHGALELAASGVAVAKTVAPFLLPFLL